MATIPNDVMQRMILEQRVRIEYILGLYNQMASPALRVDSSRFDKVDIETSVPMYDVMATPQHVALVSSMRGGSPDHIEFELSDQQFQTMEKMVMMTSNVKKKPGIPASDDPRFRIKCDPNIKQLPALLMSKGLRDLMPDHGGRKAKTTMLAFQCPCPKSFFCPSVKDIFTKGQDILHWGSQVRRPKLNQPVIFFVAVPVVDYILYVVPIEASIKTDWDDVEVKKYMTYGLNEDVTTFFDDPLDVGGHLEFFMLRDQIMNVSMHVQSILEAHIGNDVMKMTEKFVNGMCISPHHNYGTNRKVLEFMKFRPDAARVAVACFELYGICPSCYQNANPAFSLLDDNLF